LSDETTFSDVLKWLEEKTEQVEDAEAIYEYEMAHDHLQYGLQAEYLEKDSEQYDF